MTATTMSIQLRARFVAVVRAHLELPDAGAVCVTVGSEAVAREVLLDLTESEQARVRIAWLVPSPR